MARMIHRPSAYFVLAWLAVPLAYALDFAFYPRARWLALAIPAAWFMLFGWLDWRDGRNRPG